MWRRFFARLAQIVGAWGLLTIFSITYDDVLYPLAIYKWGVLIGGGTMAVIAATMCLIMLWWYNRSGTDWLGVNVIEGIKAKGEGWVSKLDSKAQRNTFWYILRIILFLPSRFFLIVLWAVKKNDVLAFVALNIGQDPFVTTVFLRHGRFGGMTKRDWLVFWGSVAFSNGYWIARNVALIEIIRFGWHNIVQS